MGNVATETNAKGMSTTYTYDSNYNLTAMKDAAGTVKYQYDALNRVTGVTDRRGNSNTHGYTDFHCRTPSVETSLEGPHGPEVVLSDYVVDYTRLNIDQRVLMEH